MTRKQLTVAVVVALAVPLSASAQETNPGWRGRGFLSASTGVQTASPNFGYDYSATMFYETAKAGLDIPGKTGIVFDFGGGVRLVKNLGVGVVYSRYSKERTATLTTTIPSPGQIYGIGVASTIERRLPVRREEDAVHFQAIYKVAITNKVQIGAFGGPSYFRCLDDVVSLFVLEGDMAFVPPAGFAWSVDFRNITQTVDKDNAWGYHGGVDVTYLLTSRVGVSATMRYSHASHHAVNRLANTDDLEDTGIWGMGDTTEVVAMDHGGFHWNGGVTFRF